MSRRFRYDPQTDSVVEVGREPVSKAFAWTAPLHCEALAVDPKHLPFQRIEDAAVGIKDQEYDRNGAPVFNSPGKYYEYMKAHGYAPRGRVHGKRWLDNHCIDLVSTLRRFGNDREADELASYGKAQGKSA